MPDRVPPPKASLVRWATEDLTAIRTLLEQAQEALMPGRAAWVDPQLSDEQIEAAGAEYAMDRAGRHRLALFGLTTLSAHAAPTDLHRVTLLQTAEWILTQLTDTLRGHLQLGPILTPEELTDRTKRATALAGMQARYRDVPDAVIVLPGGKLTSRWRVGLRTVDLDLIRSSRAEREVLVHACRDWLTRSGLAAIDGELLDHAVVEIRMAWRWLRVAAGHLDNLTRRLAAPCPTCGRRELRIDMTADARPEWEIRCATKTPTPCAARWPYAEWGVLSQQIGVDVHAAAEPAA